MSPIDAPCCCECFGTLAVAVGLTVGELAPSPSRSKPEVGDDRWDPGVSDCVVQNGFFLFSAMNE